MHDFLIANRHELIVRCRLKVAERSAPRADQTELEHGTSHFLSQLIKTLQLEQTNDPDSSQRISGRTGGGNPLLSEIGETAAKHGRELLQHGFTVEQVVHDYGDMCQAITDLAFEKEFDVDIGEFRTLNRCLDNAIAFAVTEFNYQRDTNTEATQVLALNVRLGSFAHELRNLLTTATLALAAVRSGNVGLGGPTGAMLDRSLVSLRSLIDQSLADVRLTAGLPLPHRLFSLAEFIAEIKVAAMLEAHVKGCSLAVSDVDRGLAVAADRDLLFAALGNLLQNAFKFSHEHGEVILTAYASGDRILIDVEDQCGGLPDGAADNMFRPFTQFDGDKSGMGLGLSIARRSIEANDGSLGVRDVPGSGCVFTISLPRHATASIGTGVDGGQ